MDVPEKNDRAKRRYVYYLSRADYEKEWGKEYEHPGPFARVLAFMFKLVPKVGPFKAIAFKAPSTQTEDMYLKSLDATVAHFKKDIAQINQRELHLQNVNFDTGDSTIAGRYKLTDDSYAYLLGKLDGRHFDIITPELRNNILTFYGDLKAPVNTRSNKQEWTKLQQRLQQLNRLRAIEASH